MGLAPDVVHFEFGSLARSRMTLPHRAGAAATVSFRGFDMSYVGLEDPEYYRAIWDHADGIHVLSDHLWERSIERGATPDLPHTKIPPAVDTTHIPVRTARPGVIGTPDMPLRLVSVGRLHWTKGYEYALEAVAKLRSRGLHVQYKIIGDGDLHEASHFWRHQLGLDDHAEFLGAIAHHEVANHYEWADLLLHAATTEGFCNAVLEAQAHGVPVVTSDAGGLAENVEDGVTGLVVPRRDSTALANALQRLANDEAQRLTMSTAGPLRVETHFSLKDQLDAWENFFAEAKTTYIHRYSSSGRLSTQWQ
ncbi:MAG: glycosyltransferase family 4 protein, partial [Acidimicrobiales bacterium]|nr:glycosyltransferase family 4 protein [Acidimicrobiales bacterium]